jgi:hypothetical protein
VIIAFLPPGKSITDLNGDGKGSNPPSFKNLPNALGAEEMPPAQQTPASTPPQTSTGSTPGSGSTPSSGTTPATSATPTTGS